MGLGGGVSRRGQGKQVAAGEPCPAHQRQLLLPRTGGRARHICCAPQGQTGCLGGHGAALSPGPGHGWAPISLPVGISSMYLPAPGPSVSRP